MDNFWHFWKVQIPVAVVVTGTWLWIWFAVEDFPPVKMLAVPFPFFGTIAFFVGLISSVLVTFHQRSIKKGCLAGLEFFLETLVGSYAGYTTGCFLLRLMAPINGGVAAAVLAVICSGIGLIIGVSWQGIGQLVYQDLQKNRA
jgi:hypothetical protein